MDEKHIRLLAAFEQVSAFLSEFSTFLYSYHRDLVNAGFHRNEALKLVQQLQEIMFKQSFNLGPDTDDFQDDEEI